MMKQPLLSRSFPFRGILAAACLALLLAGCCRTPSLENAVLIDARSLEEYEKDGHLDGAILIPHDQLSAVIETRVPDKDTLIYVHCSKGRRSEMAQKTLKEKGYTRVKNLGGLESAAKRLDREIVK
ncbi:MAG: rhodanese-like domain-containing protein [Verrucomicrobiota bacterium]|jgi:phage shock protein E|nr:rhodanese-like domain-containing protein [Verrucomicrobiota bacterium]